MAILNPAPRGPSMLSSGILQSSRIMLAVEEPLMPNLSSFFPRESPGCGMGIRNALIPYRHKKIQEIKIKISQSLYLIGLSINVQCHTLCLSFLSVVANTTVAEASQLLVIQALVPFSTHSSPS